MLPLTIPDTELFNDSTNEFVYVKGQTIMLEHSLLSISKWESKWRIPFMTDEKKTRAQFDDYLKCMTVTTNVDPNLYLCITRKQREDILKYMDTPQTASVVNTNEPKRHSNQFITSELIYSWMVGYQIPFSAEKWHISRLIMLIKICNENNKNQKPKQIPPKTVMKQNAALNAARRKALNSRG